MTKHEAISMRHNAELFLRSAEHLLATLPAENFAVKFSESGHAVPGIVLAAFAAEQGLKALLKQADPCIDPKAFRHNLNEMYSAIPEDQRIFIFSRCRRLSSDVKEAIGIASHAFEKWRYSFEAEGVLRCDYQTLMDVAEACIELFDKQQASQPLSG